MMGKNQSVTPIPCSIEEFFHYWLVFTKPFHKLGNREIEVLSIFLFKRFELSKIIKEDSLVDKYLFSSDVREELRAKTAYNKNHFHLILTNLRRSGILSSENNINKRFIPDISEDATSFNLLYQFTIKDDK